MRKQIIIIFSFLKDLKLKNGISAFSSQQLTNDRPINVHAIQSYAMIEIGILHQPPQKIAFAGVAKPINDSCWRSSTLNFARRRAEKAAMISARPAHQPSIGLR